MINRMKKLSVLALSADKGPLLRDLMWLYSVEIAKQEEAEEALLSRIDCSAERAELELRLAKLEAAARYLAPLRTVQKKLLPGTLSRRQMENPSPEIKKAVEAAEETETLEREIKEAEAEIRRLASYRESLSVWMPYDVPLGFAGTEKAAVLIGSVPISVKPEALALAADAACEGACSVAFVGEDTTARYFSAVCHIAFERSLSGALAAFGFLRASFPAGTETASAETEKAKAEEAALQKRTEEKTARLKELALCCADMEKAYDITATELETLRAAELLRGTETTVSLTAWVPEKQMGRVEKVLSSYVCAYEFTDPAEGDDVPVQLQNGKLITPFEALVGLYSLPKYGTFDPTFWSAVFFSIFFGMMNADVGYGLLLTIGCLVLTKMLRAKGTMKKFLDMFAISGVAGIVGGVLFGGYFGDAPQVVAREIFGKELPASFALAFNPMDEPIVFFILSLALGGVHLLWGLGIKFYILWKNHEYFSAVFDIGCWFVLFGGAGLYFLIGKAGLYIALTGVAMIVFTHGRDKKNIIMKFLSGVLGLYDLVSYMSDLLSYSRVLALGLSSAVIAQVFNILATIGGRSPATILLFPLIFVFGHVLNLALGVLGGFVHASRLQYIEFYGKFFEGGGREFRPLAPSAKYTEPLDTLSQQSV